MYMCVIVYWQRSGVPQQYVLESKYLGGQAVYRFETENDGHFVINLQASTQQMKSLKTGDQWAVLRRPVAWLSFMSRPYVNCFIMFNSSIANLLSLFM